MSAPLRHQSASRRLHLLLSKTHSPLGECLFLLPFRPSSGSGVGTLFMWKGWSLATRAGLPGCLLSFLSLLRTSVSFCVILSKGSPPCRPQQAGCQEAEGTRRASSHTDPRDSSGANVRDPGSSPTMTASLCA